MRLRKHNTRKTWWQVANVLSVLFALAMNGLVGAQLIGLPAINVISDKYATLLTPAGYAFGIWSLIYTLLLLFAVYQARDVFNPKQINDLPPKMGPWFVIANICNGLWTWLYVQEWMGLSVLVLVLLTGSLYVLLVRLRIALDDVSAKTITFVWWPLLIYTGWVTVATVANGANWLKSISIEMSTLMAIGVLCAIGAALIVLMIFRSVRELLLAAAWGIGAIGAAQLDGSGNRIVAIVALTVAAVLLVAVAVHGYSNRRRSILAKLYRKGA